MPSFLLIRNPHETVFRDSIRGGARPNFGQQVVAAWPGIVDQTLVSDPSRCRWRLEMSTLSNRALRTR
jgi:hypothetical protein